jgi:hypothetical protein
MSRDEINSRALVTTLPDVQVLTNEGRMPAPAIIDLGQFAITESLLDGYALTHKQTGAALEAHADIARLMELYEQVWWLDWSGDSVDELYARLKDYVDPIVRAWRNGGKVAA